MDPNDINIEISKLSPKAGDIIALKIKGPHVHDNMIKVLEQLAKAREDCLFVIIEDEQNLATISDENLEKVGLMRIPGWTKPEAKKEENDGEEA